MNYWMILIVALRSLRRTLLRSSLTALGIIIGVAAVITMVSIGSGARERVQESLSGLDASLLTLNAGVPMDQRRLGRRAALPPSDGLRLDDYAAIRAQVDGLAAASVQVRGPSGEAQAFGRGGQAQVIGIDVEGLSVLSRRLVRGAAFGATDVATAASVCLISESLAEELFERRDPIGQPVRIRNMPFVVIGLIADDPRIQQQQLGVHDPTVLLPYTSVLRRLDRNAAFSIDMKAETPARVDEIQQAVTDLMERRRGQRTAEFRAFSQGQGIQAYLEGRRTMNLLLGSIAGVSLLVGGIGVMNIMLVSVTERTREIGIRMAIGTRSRDVLRQFLVESVILSLLGGAIGIALGAVVARLLATLYGWPTVITGASVLAAFGCSALIGVAFGYYPARQAARLDPIEALRFE